MACITCAIFWVIGIVLAIKIYKKIKKCRKPLVVPQLDEKWWGPRGEGSEDTSIKPFKIQVSDKVLDDLRTRLEKARPFVPPLEGAKHHYGLNTNLLNTIVEFWKTKYDWRAREAYLNKYPQFTVSIQGLRIHYLHVKPENPDKLKVLPLLILHGWPGSVREFYELIPLLTTPQPGRKFIFEVIAPSLPGYGFSEAAVRPGLGAAEAAVIFKNLMVKLGFGKYYIQGGDWGALIVQNMATLFPERLLGLHTNMPSVRSAKTTLKIMLCKWFPSLIVPKRYQDRVYPVMENFGLLILESGYFHIQATKPDTVGVGLNDSPVGLAAYILEKFIAWTKKEWKDRDDGGLDSTYTYTTLLDNVMIYWITESITTSMRFYAENFTKEQRKLKIMSFPITVPAAIARMVDDLLYTPPGILNDKFKNILHDSDLEGGHFAALQVPKMLANDIYDGIENIEAYHRNH